MLRVVACNREEGYVYENLRIAYGSAVLGVLKRSDKRLDLGLELWE